MTAPASNAAETQSGIGTQTTRRQFLSGASALAIAPSATADSDTDDWLYREGDDGTLEAERVSVSFDSSYPPSHAGTIEIERADGKTELLMLG